MIHETKQAYYVTRVDCRVDVYPHKQFVFHYCQLDYLRLPCCNVFIYLLNWLPMHSTVNFYALQKWIFWVISTDVCTLYIVQCTVYTYQQRKIQLIQQMKTNMWDFNLFPILFQTKRIFFTQWIIFFFVFFLNFHCILMCLYEGILKSFISPRHKCRFVGHGFMHTYTHTHAHLGDVTICIRTYHNYSVCMYGCNVH